MPLKSRQKECGVVETQKRQTKCSALDAKDTRGTTDEIAATGKGRLQEEQMRSIYSGTEIRPCHRPCGLNVGGGPCQEAWRRFGAKLSGSLRLVRGRGGRC